MPRTTKQQQKAVYLPTELVEKWQQSAKKNHRSMNSELIVALERYFEGQKEERVNKMINHEVTIIGFNGDISEVNAALVNAGIQINAEEAESQGKESSVFVSPDQIGQAVQVINGLGYETDEDEQTEE